MVKEMLQFIDESPNAFLAVDSVKKVLKEHDYIELKESEPFSLEKGKKYYVTRNDSSIIAFNVGKGLNNPSFHITASHTDCPSFKLKPNAIIKDGNYVKLNVEVYGGPLFTPWLDRPLSIAGRVIVETKEGLSIRHINVDKDLCLIPSLAIHMNAEANSGFKMNPQVDLLPVIGLDQDFDLNELLANELSVSKEEVLSHDLFLYPRQKGIVWGRKDEFFSSFHIDNLECTYTTMMGFVDSFEENSINVFAAFDNEETGSLTRQGADSDFLYRVLNKIADAFAFSYDEAVARSMLLSCDNAHATHPNHGEKADQTNRPFMNKGIVIKSNANQSYTSDSLGMSILLHILKKHEIPYQFYTNRSDMRGGSTLGNLSNRHVSILSVDIGLAQLAMHSPFETAGSEDVKHMIDGIKAFYQSRITFRDRNVVVE